MFYPSTPTPTPTPTPSATTARSKSASAVANDSMASAMSPAKTSGPSVEADSISPWNPTLSAERASTSASSASAPASVPDSVSYSYSTDSYPSSPFTNNGPFGPARSPDDAPASLNAADVTRNKRCPRGTRRNKKSGSCEPSKRSGKKSAKASPASTVANQFALAHATTLKGRVAALENGYNRVAAKLSLL